MSGVSFDGNDLRIASSGQGTDDEEGSIVRFDDEVLSFSHFFHVNQMTTDDGLPGKHRGFSRSIPLTSEDYNGLNSSFTGIEILFHSVHSSFQNTSPAAPFHSIKTLKKMSRFTSVAVIFAIMVMLVAVGLTHAQSATQKVLNKAIYDMLSDKDTSYGFTKIHQVYFGDSTLHAPVAQCQTFVAWPNTTEIAREVNGTIGDIINRGFIIFGANSVSNIPKRYNYTAVGSNYGTVIGFEAGRCYLYCVL